jgi:hypothetical protein
MRILQWLLYCARTHFRSFRVQDETTGFVNFQDASSYALLSPTFGHISAPMNSKNSTMHTFSGDSCKKENDPKCHDFHGEGNLSPVLSDIRPAETGLCILHSESAGDGRRAPLQNCFYDYSEAIQRFRPIGEKA